MSQFRLFYRRRRMIRHGTGATINGRRWPRKFNRVARPQATPAASDERAWRCSLPADDSEILDMMVANWMLEMGYAHSAFALQAEARLPRTMAGYESIPWGTLVELWSKGIVSNGSSPPEPPSAPAFDFSVTPIDLRSPHFLKLKGRLRITAIEVKETRLAIGDAGGGVTVWDFSQPNRVRMARHERIQAPVSQMVFGTKSLAVAGADGSVCILSPERRRALAPVGALAGLEWVGESLFVAGSDGAIWSRNLCIAEGLDEFGPLIGLRGGWRIFEEGVMSGESRFPNSEGARNLVVAIGDRPAVADSRGRVRILDEPAADFVAARGIRQMVWVGRTLAIVHADGVVEAGVAASWMAPVQAQVAIGFCGHVVGAGDRFLVAMDASTGKVVARFLAAAPVVALAADGDLLVMGHADGTAVVLERSAFMAAVAGQRGC